MASVSSLDQDMRQLRLDRYTPAAANEARSWIESTLGERLPSGDLLDILKDGVALCRLANMVLPPPGIKYKVSNMPFTQRENISHFLTACERPPLELPAHDRFLTVDLYDNKDPTQVIQCLGAFSRAANAVNPAKFPAVLGPKRQPSPTRTPTTSSVATVSDSISRGTSNASNVTTSSATTSRFTNASLSPSPSQSSKAAGSGPITSWSSKTDELTSAPAWNIHQYGYMGGASQGNQGISFGARRQIVNPDVNVPSLAEKEKRRRELEAEQEQARLEAEQAEARRKAEIEAQERQAKLEEDQRRQEETRKAREQERLLVEEEKRRWEDEERKWKEEEDRRKREEQEQQDAAAKLPLTGQYLSQYQSEQQQQQQRKSTSPQTAESARIQELERQLEQARERERRYQLEREGRSQSRERTPEALDPTTSSYRRPTSLSPSRKAPATPPLKRDSWSPDNREQLRDKASSPQESTPTPAIIPSAISSRPLPTQANPQSSPSTSSDPAPSPQRPLPDPVKSTTSPSPFARPLPDPTKITTSTSSPSPFTRPQASPFTRPSSPPKSHFPVEMSLTSTSEQAAEDARRAAGQAKTKAGGLASKSLLEREMERERERQREWEQNQMLRAGQQPGAGTAGSGARVLGPREPPR